VEQERLLEALRRALAQLDEGKALLQKALALVMDRRIALITAAVTGQIDVETYNKKLGPAKVAV
jgi:type I restriction enzyme S subunit